MGWHLPSSGSSCVCSSLWWHSPWWHSPWWPIPRWPSQCVLLPCHAQPQLAAQLPCQPLLLLLFHIRLNYQRGSARRERSNLRTSHHSSGQGCASRLPQRCCREPLTHGREQPLEHVGSQVLVGALSSSAAAPSYSRVNPPNTESSPGECQHTAALLLGPWKKECLLLQFDCSSAAQGTGHTSQLLLTVTSQALLHFCSFSVLGTREVF